MEQVKSYGKKIVNFPWKERKQRHFHKNSRIELNDQTKTKKDFLVF